MSVFIIGEIGINHNGSLKKAKELIDYCHEANLDAVKFQKRDIDTVYSKEFLDSPRESPWGKTQRDQKNGLEFGKDEYDEIDTYCKTLNISWSASAWDVKSLEFLDNYKLPFHKIASPMNTHIPFVTEVARRKIKTFISTGMSTFDEIKKIVDIFEKNNCPYELMHCNSSYPMNEADANLNRIKTLREYFGCNVGYSGHETSLLKICNAAVALGATSIERHITLDRAMYGSDQSSSVEVTGHTLQNFASVIRKIPTILGSHEIEITESEKPIREKLKIIRE